MHKQNTTDGPKKQGDGTSFIHKTLREARFTPPQFVVFCHIKSRGKCFAGSKRMAQETGLARGTVKRAKRELLERNAIRVTGRGFPKDRPDLETDIYEANHPSEWLPVDRGSKQTPCIETDRGSIRYPEVTPISTSKETKKTTLDDLVSSSSVSGPISEHGTKTKRNPIPLSPPSPRVAVKTIEAKYDGKCSLCHKKFLRGDAIHILNPREYAHPVCQENKDIEAQRVADLRSDPEFIEYERRFRKQPCLAAKRFVLNHGGSEQESNAAFNTFIDPMLKEKTFMAIYGLFVQYPIGSTLPESPTDLLNKIRKAA